MGEEENPACEEKERARYCATFATNVRHQRQAVRPPEEKEGSVKEEREGSVKEEREGSVEEGKEVPQEDMRTMGSFALIWSGASATEVQRP